MLLTLFLTVHAHMWTVANKHFWEDSCCSFILCTILPSQTGWEITPQLGLTLRADCMVVSHGLVSWASVSGTYFGCADSLGLPDIQHCLGKVTRLSTHSSPLRPLDMPGMTYPNQASSFCYMLCHLHTAQGWGDWFSPNQVIAPTIYFFHLQLFFRCFTVCLKV